MDSQVHHITLQLLNPREKGGQYVPDHFVVSKCRTIAHMDGVLVGRESPPMDIIHVGCLNVRGQRDFLKKQFSQTFSEFLPGEITVVFHPLAEDVCAHILKKQRNPHCWGVTAQECRKKGWKRVQPPSQTYAAWRRTFIYQAETRPDLSESSFFPLKRKKTLGEIYLLPGLIKFRGWIGKFYRRWK